MMKSVTKLPTKSIANLDKPTMFNISDHYKLKTFFFANFFAKNITDFWTTTTIIPWAETSQTRINY